MRKRKKTKEQVYLSARPPCIDAADDNAASSTDIVGNPRIDIPNTGIVDTLADMGAYEFQGRHD